MRRTTDGALPAGRRTLRPRRPFGPSGRSLLGLLLLASLAGCGRGPASTGVSDPIATLSTTESTDRQLATAMDILDPAPTPEYITALRRMLHVPGYTVRARTEALDRLARLDPDAMQRTLETQLPRLAALEWRRRVCEIIAERGWTQYGPTLVRAWAHPMPGWVDRDEDRPERLALERLVGRERLPDYLFETMLQADPVAQQNLRTRCWELLLSLGQRDRLRALLADATIAPEDRFLADLRAAAVELGLFPETREEILWLRALREPARAEFWSQARQATGALSPQRRGDIEVRDLPVVVAAFRIRPPLLEASDEALAAGIESWLASAESGRVRTISFEGWAGDYRQTFREWRRDLRWGDLLAMTLLVEAIRVPAVQAHLFDFGDRDVRDRTTEFGGVLRVDDADRLALVEFAPRVRGNDERFEVPQEMVDAGYVAILHFHFHATRHDNVRYAAPAQGDRRYADAMRINGAVFTFVDRNTLNVDFYRHGGVSVDLGSIRRPGS